MNRSEALEQKRVFWVQRPNSNTFNDGEYQLRLLNDDVVKVGDRVSVRFSNGDFTGTVKQISGFGMNETRAVVSVIFEGRKSGKKVDIDSVLRKVN